MTFDKYERSGAYHWRFFPTNPLLWWRYNPYMDAQYQIPIDVLASQLPPVKGEDREVLDVGCGDGVTAFRLTKAGYRVAGVDPERLALDFAVEEFARRGAAAPEFQEGSCDKLPFDDGRFDAVLGLELIEHLDTGVTHAFLAEANRVLKPGGVLVVTTPHKQTPELRSPYHTHEYQATELRELLETTFTDVSVYGYFGRWQRLAYGVGWRLTGKPARLLWKIVGRLYNPFARLNGNPTIADEHVLAVGRKAETG